MARPLGHRLCEPYKYLDARRFLPEINYNLPYRGGLVRVDVSLRSFLCAIENGHTGALGVAPLFGFVFSESAKNNEFPRTVTMLTIYFPKPSFRSLPIMEASIE